MAYPNLRGEGSVFAEMARGKAHGKRIAIRARSAYMLTYSLRM
jgi:hypothetical protein